MYDNIDLVKGSGKLTTLIAVLRCLNKVEILETFIPEEPFSPIEMLKLKNKQRLRASKFKEIKENQDKPQW